jgi:phospholipid N-methyltransferase
MRFTGLLYAASIINDDPVAFLPAKADRRLSDSITFIKEFLKHPTKVGAIAPSSPGLVAAMVDGFDWETVRQVVEFGPGTGVFTEAIVERLHPDAKFIAIERSPDLAAVVQERCPSAKIVQDSATNLNAICDSEGMGRIDAVICGLPWASFPESLQREIMDPMIGRMAEGGRFATFAYWQGVVLPAGRRFSKRLHASFRTVGRSDTVWRNLPPAFVYRCQK